VQVDRRESASDEEGGEMVRFVHTADWQLGMTRHFLEGRPRPASPPARLDAVRRIGSLAADEGCAFVVVCGDVFESNHLDRQVIVRSLEAMGEVPVPFTGYGQDKPETRSRRSTGARTLGPRR